MLNLLVKQPLPPSKPIVFGGNINSTLVTWLQQLGVMDFLHAGVVVRSIDPVDIQLSADHIRKNYGHVSVLFSVGTFAHRTLTAAGLEHGTLPATSTKNLKEIEAALNQCRNYLLRSAYAPKSNPNVSS